ncbi:acyltransferase [Prevotella sp. E13-17]|uniref:acyltransferase family protein n=1 Tax=Prevotella sp. E13-17 TaxID=2913616 RepID=UPI001EDA4A5F|nr:acyltransferase family protein [Prevotella sp. E13-17]UKK50374.1 acyltransferase [Prevotella sp. E13-17]
MKKQRIEYLDAMRGFTMLLVVVTHVSGFGLGLAGSDTVSLSTILAQFRMPLFFFLSGFLLYKTSTVWNLNTTIAFLKKKIPVQIVTPTIFMLASISIRNISAYNCVFDYQKSGYWFTFVLFIFFCIYIFSNVLLDMVRAKSYLRDVLLFFSAFVLYVLTTPITIPKWPVSEEVCGFLCIPEWGYYFFFIIGIIVRKHFSSFEKMLDNTPAIFVAIVLYFSFNIYSDFFRVYSSTLFNILTSISGLLLVFAFFRKNEVQFGRNGKLGRIMQYVGRRTLDIYLIHYFFIFSRLSNALPDFSCLDSPFLEFLVSVIIGAVIVACSLLVSSIIRMSPFINHWMFGAKRVFAE